MGSNNLSEIVVITDERKTVNELYVNAIAGFLVAIIAAHIIGKYEFTKTQVVFIATTASFSILTKENITTEIMVSADMKYTI